MKNGGEEEEVQDTLARSFACLMRRDCVFLCASRLYSRTYIRTYTPWVIRGVENYVRGHERERERVSGGICARV